MAGEMYVLSCIKYPPLLRYWTFYDILEIGAGTGGATASVLNGLKSRFGDRLYSEYTFTDISTGSFVTAKERFKEIRGMRYKILDISKDPLEQGFQEASSDLILASNVGLDFSQVYRADSALLGASCNTEHRLYPSSRTVPVFLV